MRKLIIFGGSGIGMIAASVAEDNKSHVIEGFLNDVIPVGELIGKYRQFPVIGNSADYQKYLDDPMIDFFIGYVGMKNEKDVFDKIKKINIPSDRWATLIHSSAIIPQGYCKIGKGVLIAPLCQLSADTTVSDNCILLPNSFLGHDSFMDEFSHIATNAVVGANVHVGKACHVGSNATIREKVVVGDFSLIGAGAVVLRDVEESSIVAGNPAKKLR
jgi:acetyltransferase EpsM